MKANDLMHQSGITMKSKGFSVDEPILSEWVGRYEQPLLRYTCQITGNPETAKEVVQDTFLKILREPDKAPSPLTRPWLYRVCRNRAIDVLRKENRMETMTDEYQEGLIDSGPTPDEATAQSETGVRLMSMIRRLPDRQQEVLCLKFHSGMSYREIAKTTELSESNVGFLIHQAIQTLRREMKKISDYVTEAQ
jgi:RNA polymerase sigma-70 factor (ECF subfamily)